MEFCPEPGPLKRAREPNLPSSEFGEAGALCAGAHHTPSALSIEYDVHVRQPKKNGDSPSFRGKYLSCRGKGSPCSTAECEALDASASLQCWLESRVRSGWVGLY